MRIFGKWGGMWRFALYKIADCFETHLNDNEARGCRYKSKGEKIV